MQMLGQILLERGLVSHEDLQRALAISHKTRSRLGDVLIGEGILGYLPLYKALAQHYKLDFVNLLTLEPDSSLLSEKMAESYLQMRAIPYLRHNGITTIATAEISTDVVSWAKAHYGNHIQFAITSPFDIQRTVQRLYAHKFTHMSTSSLYEEQPISSARKKVSTAKRLYIAFVLTMLFFIIGILTNQLLVLFVSFCYGIYGLSMLFKILIYAGGMWHGKRTPSTAHMEMDDSTLPIYTILVPMYQETESLPNLLQAMERLDYPAAKLDIKLVLEDDDTAMIEAAKALRPRYQFDIVLVPKSQPRTKPKACNYALRFARGEYVTIFDADDRPDPEQLKKAIHTFQNSPPEVICLQARLNYYNTHDNWLTRCFSLEYAMLFNVLLYGMEFFRIPILLGGTSNHISLAKLKELGEWDPYNVTEDADLGTRLATRGYVTHMLDSDTLEEAPISLHAWVRQRSRWVKGYMQTWIVHMRRPGELFTQFRPHGFLGFQCFVAMASFSYLTAPIVWLIALLWLFGNADFFPHWLFIVATGNLLLNFVVHILTAAHTASKYERHRFALFVCALTYPFYLILHSVASYVSLYQFFAKPYFWEKTRHGLARTFEQIKVA